MNKTLITVLLLLCTFLISMAQDTARYKEFHIILNKNVWFYPGDISPTDVTAKRFPVFAKSRISFTQRPGFDFFRANYQKQFGFVEARMVSPEYQQFGSLTDQSIGFNSSIINEAGTNIRRGGNGVIIGTVIALAGTAAGILIAKSDHDTGTAVAYGSAGLGLVITLFGYGGIAAGGRKLEEFRQ